MTALKNIEAIIKEVNGTMAMEGMPITEEDKSRIRMCLTDDAKFNATVAALISKHTLPAVRENA